MTDADTEAGRGEGLADIDWLHYEGPEEVKSKIAEVCRDVTRASCIDEVCINDIVTQFRHLGYEVVPSECLRESDPGGERCICVDDDGRIANKATRENWPVCAPTDEAPEADPYDGEEACPNINCGRGWGHEGPCDAPPPVEEGERGELRDTLERYGQHHGDCYWLDPDRPAAGCNCGWQQRVQEMGLDVRLGVPPLEKPGLHGHQQGGTDG